MDKTLQIEIVMLPGEDCELVHVSLTASDEWSLIKAKQMILAGDLMYDALHKAGRHLAAQNNGQPPTDLMLDIQTAIASARGGVIRSKTP